MMEETYKKVLALDSSGLVASVAVVEGDGYNSNLLAGVSVNGSFYNSLYTPPKSVLLPRLRQLQPSQNYPMPISAYLRRPLFYCNFSIIESLFQIFFNLNLDPFFR